MSFRALSILAALAVVVCMGSAAVADVVTFQEGVTNPLTGSAYVGSEDNCLLFYTTDHNNWNYGSADQLYFGNNGTLDRHNLVRFDLTSLQGQYADVNSVTLRMFINGAGVNIITAANTIDAYRLTNNNIGWVEGTANGAVQPGSSTWNQAKNAQQNWASATPGTAAADYVGAAIDSEAYDASTPGSQSYIDLTFNDVSFINSWIAGNNPGLVLRPGSASTDSLLNFYSTENATASLRPQLIVDYTPIVADVPTDNVIGHWQLDEAAGASVAVDASGNGRDGTLLGAITPGQAGAVAYSGTSYDMQDARVHVPADAGTASESFSFSTWFKPDSLPAAGDYMGIVDNRMTHLNAGTLEEAKGYTVHYGSDGLLRWLICDGDSISFFATPTPVAAGDWTHLALTYDADSNSAKMYVDGVAVIDETADYVPNEVYDLSLGSMSGYGGIDADQTLNHYQFNGDMDDAWLFDTALNGAQIASLMNTGNPVPEPGCLALLLGITAGTLLIRRKR